MVLRVCMSSVVIVLNYFANQVRVSKLDRISQFVMVYGGLRGAIAFSLSVVLNKKIIPSRQLFITTTIVVVYFTNIVLGSTIQPLVKLLKVKIQQKSEVTMNETVAEKVFDYIMVGIEGISQELGHNYIRQRFLQCNYTYLRPLITGCKPSDKVHSPGSHLLSVYKRLNEHDALTIARVPTDPEALMHWNESLRNITQIVRNNSSFSILETACSTENLSGADTAGATDHNHIVANSLQVPPHNPRSLQPHKFSLDELASTDLSHSDSAVSLPGQHADDVNVRSSDHVQTMTPAMKGHIRHAKSGTLAGGSLRERGGRDADNLPTHRRFRPRCVQQQQQQPDNDVIADEGRHGHENPSYCAASQVTFHIGGGGDDDDDDDDATASVTVTVTDVDAAAESRQSTSTA